MNAMLFFRIKAQKIPNKSFKIHIFIIISLLTPLFGIQAKNVDILFQNSTIIRRHKRENISW